MNELIKFEKVEKVEKPDVNIDISIDDLLSKIQESAHAFRRGSIEFCGYLFILKHKTKLPGKRGDLTEFSVRLGWHDHCKNIGIDPKTVDSWFMNFGWMPQKALVTKLTGNNEWYTPTKYIEAARSAMGSIDLDPASNEIAQETVKANDYYTEENSGLDKDWNGNIWLNPPYEAQLIKQFIDKLINSDVNQYTILTHNNTDTSWWHKLANNSDAICFTSGRINFYNGVSNSAPTQGQCFFYKGSMVDRFNSEFSDFGKVIIL